MDINHLLKIAKLFPPLTRTHYSIILRDGLIVGIGKENRKKTHPLAAKKGYKYPTIHSELAALIDLGKTVNPKDCALINFRLTPSGVIGMAKPCKYCLGWCCETFKEIWYTDTQGNLVRL